MGEELHESDVMWPEADGGGEAAAASDNEEREVTSSRKTAAAEEEGWSRRWAASSSPPVGIPGGGSRIRKEGEDGEAEEEEWEPPHVVASRRWAEAGFSGEGRRRLKGRELRHVRDAVLRMTGFFEGSCYPSATFTPLALLKGSESATCPPTTDKSLRLVKVLTLVIDFPI
ncbi:uncharacterized protein LOC122040363 [Zingiber officinale]|uniref:uncharacterized protein LOC122040363 n=1 Tax=Zingiber officinale TaxID=94328 RepID=UPI001C4DA964|nr:uncharacterized protein LOC122040363 [Zingiber officinale]